MADSRAKARLRKDRTRAIIIDDIFPGGNLAGIIETLGRLTTCDQGESYRVLVVDDGESLACQNALILQRAGMETWSWLTHRPFWRACAGAMRRRRVDSGLQIPTACRVGMFPDISSCVQFIRRQTPSLS